MAPAARKGGKRRRRYDDLFAAHLPRSANAICSNSMVSALPPETRTKLRDYLLDRCPGSAEIADALFWVAEAHPKQLRTKELCETIEAVTLVGNAINHLRVEDAGRGNTMTIYDLACGHGLAGTLLAYRFPGMRVVCVDLERRPCWTSYREAFEKFGEKAEGNDTVTANLEYQVGDATTIAPNEGDYLLCLHGCNELSPFVLSTALQHRTGFAVMPCCLRERMLGVTTTSGNQNWGMDDGARYALQVGYLAGKFGCAKVAAISHFITNRYLIILGDWKNQSGSRES